MSQPGGYTIAPGEEWTGLAAAWPVIVASRATEPGHLKGKVTQLHLCCAWCPDLPSVFCLNPDSSKPFGYRVAVKDMLAAVLAHIRRSHET